MRDGIPNIHRNVHQWLVLMKFPGRSLAVAGFVWQPMLEAALVAAVHSSEQQVIGGFGFLYAFWIVAGIASVVWFLRRFGAAFATFPQSRPVTGELHTDIICPYGKWDDDDFVKAHNVGFCAQYSSLFEIYRGRRHWFFAVELLLSFLHASIAAVQPTEERCGGLFAGLLAVHILYCMSIVVLRPFGSRIELCIGGVLGFGGLVVTALLCASMQTDDPDVKLAAAWSALGLQIIVCLLIAFQLVTVLRLFVLSALAAAVKLRDRRKVTSTKRDVELREFLLQPPALSPAGPAAAMSLATLLQREALSVKTLPEEYHATDDELVLRHRYPRPKKRVQRTVPTGDTPKMMFLTPQRSRIHRGARRRSDDETSDNSELRMVRMSSNARVTKKNLVRSLPPPKSTRGDFSSTSSSPSSACETACSDSDVL